MRRSINKIISIIILISIVISNLPLGVINAYVVTPSFSVSRPSKSTVNAGDSVSYTITYTDAEEIYLSSSYVTLNGFDADIYVSRNGDSRTITLSNIQGTNGNKSIGIKSGSAENDAGYTYGISNSYSFNLVNNNVVNNVDIIKPSYTVSNPSRASANAGSSVSYTITFTDNSGAVKVNTTPSHISLNGFNADIYVSNSSNQSVITLTNVQGINGPKSISIKAGAAQDASGNVTSGLNSTASFNLVNNNTNNNQTNNTNNNYADTVKPIISVSTPNNSKVYAGGTVIYIVNYSDNKGISRIDLSKAHISLNGFDATIYVSNEKNRSIITLTNIQGAEGKKSISIKAGAAKDTSGNITNTISSTASFWVLKSENTKKPNTTNTVNKVNKINNSISKNNISLGITSNIATVKASNVLKSTPKVTSTCNDNVVVLGDINKEIKDFSTWLSSQRENASYVSQNNYVAKNEKSTYSIDYYNGNESSVKGVKIKLTIPYNVDVLEINSDGYIKTQTSEETVIEWDKSSVQSKAKCRLSVKVKYLENVLLENSDKISENFYVTLKTEYNSESKTSYLRQLFVDTNPNKKATVNKYLSAIDNTNSIRPDDKITRAELAKLLVDSGVVELKQENNDYTKYKDGDEVPTYARNAVSAIYSTGIIDVYSDFEFKPNNPIVRDEFFKIVAKAAEYMSNGKLKIADSPFIYTDYIDDDDKTLTDNTKYIMELIRQNIIEREDTNPDEYILRKDAAQIINALTFRGPYVEDLGRNKVKFIDVSKDSKYFYNIIAAASTYTYNYTESLNQQILEIK